MTYSAMLVADYFLSRIGAMSALKIIKMTYIAHGYNMAITKKPLIRESIESWKYGPMIPVLYHTLRDSPKIIDHFLYSNTPLDKTDMNEISHLIDARTVNILEEVIKTHGSLSDLEISSLTNNDNTPWKTCYIPERVFTTMPNSIIQKYYEELVAS